MSTIKNVNKMIIYLFLVMLTACDQKAADERFDDRFYARTVRMCKQIGADTIHLDKDGGMDCSGWHAENLNLCP